MRPAIISCAPVSPATKDCWASHGLGVGFCTYLSNNCKLGTSVKEEKYYESEGMGTVQLDQIPAHHSIWLLA